MALNKKVSKKVSISANTQNAPAPASTSASSTPASSTPDLAALQTALTAIVELVTKLDGKVAELAGELDKTNEAVASVRADLDAALEDDEDSDEDSEPEDSDEDEDKDDEDEDEEIEPADIDANKVFDQLMEFDREAQHDILAEAASNLGRKRVATTAIKKEPEVAFAIAQILSTDEYGCDMEDFV